MKIRPPVFFAIFFCVCIAAGAVGHAWTPLAVKDDPLVRMPGTQPDQGVNLEAPNRCLNCHADYNTEVEPGFNWKGSMMAQAARDFMFWACLTVAGQDSIWAVGRPNAIDICERCHFPQGWLAGRSDPPNASAMTGADFDGVHCDSCHTMYDPFFETTHNGTREGSDWLNYWDETNASDTPSNLAADDTYLEDSLQARGITLFNGGSFFVTDNLPFSTQYNENAAGQYFVSSGGEKRASFADAEARHQMLYSRYHKSKYMCASCHDVSNPVLANIAFNGTSPGDGTTILATEEKPAYSYFHVERTFSEFMLSAYGQQGGAAGIGPFAPELFNTSYPNNYITKCQDCHMRDVVGAGCDMNGVPVRPNESIEHPNSGQPLHDLTGGNAWVSYVLASAINSSPNYDPINYNLLNRGPNILTLDLTQGEGIDPVALLAGVDRAKQQLQLAASISNLSYSGGDGVISFRIQNQTGHKLISGFPEGRRMFVNIKAYDSENNLIHTVNPYDYTVGTLKGLDPSYSPNSPPLGPNEVYRDDLVYELHPSSTLTGETETFHFALATGRYKDNRIPPLGFRIVEAPDRLVEPVWHGTVDLNYFTPEEYAGGYDDLSFALVPGAERVEVNLYYQTTSREYIEFLRDEINGTASTLTGTGAGGDPPYLVQTDPFFERLKAWGDTIWQLWEHNMTVPGAEPFLMTQAIIGNQGGCDAPVPTLTSALSGQKQVTLSWSDEHSADPGIIGYGIYYDQAGKAQFVDQVGLTTTYIDTDLTNGQLYCYMVTSLYPDCESGVSNILCATPSGCNDDSDCTDGLFCNGPETCDLVSGVCQPGTNPCPETECNHCQETTDTCFDPEGTACSDEGNVCTDDQCDGTGICVHLPNNASCDDGIVCTETDLCSNGNCQGIPNDALCSDNNVCTHDSCDLSAGCIYTSNIDPCDDGLYCNGLDTCSGGTCSEHSGSPCPDDGQFCNGTESCDETIDQCISSGNPCPPPLGCNEENDVCSDCLTNEDCDDSNVCTDGTCDPVEGCIYSNNTDPCDDGLYCNGIDTCSDGACAFHTGDPCLPLQCDEESDICVEAHDSDEDGIPDPEDNCPDTHNPNQEDTMPPGGNGCGDACECEGNFDGDSDCDGTDATLFKADFGRSPFLNPCNIDPVCNGNFDCDLDVDGGDASTFKEDFGRSLFKNPCPDCAVADWCASP